MCVPKLLRELRTGVRVFDDAIPAPNAGCKTSNGANTVRIPMRSAGSKDGDRAHFKPKVDSKRAEKVIPMEW